ncbi:MAG TPA: hypothetical protein VFN67_18345 [Polyangiales bacterium]|nr:hypothetical protein [Polyangiales bacterium]
MARALLVVSCLWLGGCNQLFGIERLKPAAGAPAANSGGSGAGSAPVADEDAGT